jgi:hypothetical protein
MKNKRIWIYRGAIIVGIGALITSWFLNWWSLDIESFFKIDAIIIHPYGLEDSSQLSSALGVGLPQWFTPVIWIYFILVNLALLAGAIFTDKNIKMFGREFNLSRWLVGIAGFSYVVVAVIAVIVAAVMTGGIDGLTLIKRYYISMGGGMMSWVKGSLDPGYWLACGTGAFLIAISVLRNKIIGKNQ